MDNAGLTRCSVSEDGTNAWILNQTTSQYVVNVPQTSLTAGHDYFLVELSVEPVSGTLVFAAIGMLAPGTLAAGFFVPTVMVPNRAQLTDSWYAYEWTDANGNNQPDSNDTYRLIAHGQ